MGETAELYPLSSNQSLIAPQQAAARPSFAGITTQAPGCTLLATSTCTQVRSERSSIPHPLIRALSRRSSWQSSSIMRRCDHTGACRLHMCTQCTLATSICTQNTGPAGSKSCPPSPQDTDSSRRTDKSSSSSIMHRCDHMGASLHICNLNLTSRTESAESHL